MKRFFRVVAWFLGSAVALIVVLAVALLFINRNDRPPSPDALRMAALLHDHPAVADRDNGYVFVMGFDAPRDRDPLVYGPERIAKYRKALRNSDSWMIADPEKVVYNPADHRSAAISKLIDTCRAQDLQCAEAFNANATSVAAWVKSEQWLLLRYQKLLSFTGWHATLAPYAQTPLPPYSVVLEGQRLLLAKAWLLAGRGDVAGVRSLLESDARFWRLVLASSYRLIGKMIAVAALTRDFSYGNLILRRIPGNRSSGAVPEIWRKPLSPEELSVNGVFAGEWLFLADTIRSLPRRSDARNLDERIAWPKRMYEKAGLYLLKPQATINLDAKYMLQLADIFHVPAEQLPDALRRSRTMSHRFSTTTATFVHPYNFVGNVMVRIAIPAFAQYVTRVYDLEGVRRAALLTERLRARGTKMKDIASALAGDTLRDPYNDTPFAWDAAHRTVVFVGLEPGERGRHAFLY